MRPRPLPLAASVLASAALVVTTLAGCSFSASANLTVDAKQVASAAEDALEKKIGSRPEIDCGSKQVKLVDGTELNCTLTDPDTTSEFETTVTINDVKGTKYTVDVQVADSPKDGSSAGDNASPSTDASDAAAGSGDGTLTVTLAEVGEAAAGALESQYGERPAVEYIAGADAAQGTITIRVGTVLKYNVTVPSTGAKGVGTVTITKIDGGKYGLDVKVADY